MTQLNFDALEFAIFCIENIAHELDLDGEAAYTLLSDSGVLQNYIIPEYEQLHTQGKKYIVQDILEVLHERQVSS